MPTTHLVIDIETLSTDVNAIVTQVGWVCIEVSDEGVASIVPKDDWRHGSQNVEYANQIKAGRHLCPGTLNFWLKQDVQVFKEVTDQRAAIDRMDVFDDIKHIVHHQSINTVWAFGASFDFAILRSLWNNETPWRYKRERCARTIAGAFGQRGSGSPTHRAIEDAYQTAAMLVALHNDPFNGFTIQ